MKEGASSPQKRKKKKKNSLYLEKVGIKIRTYLPRI